MTEGSTKQIDYGQLLKEAYLSIEGLNRKVDRYEKQSSEPIAVIGMGCRFPGGANTVDEYWHLLNSGRDGISEVPRERWDIDAYYDADPDADGKMYSRWGGFIHNVAGFDPRFFGITPREAMTMDPQQRLLMEISWETLENAGCAPDALQNSLTGVFVGISGVDYAGLMNPQAKIRELYSGTGNTFSIAAGRLSYFYGFQGPCLAVDTACSSSLVSVHLAAQSLRQRECDLALAGGVNLMLAPEPTIVFCRGRMLSFDRYCKTFDASADGYVRGEGCGMVLLKRLSDARADGDRILSLLIGSAVNQDGRSSGLTAPNGVAQEAVLQAALNNARIQASQVGYVEAHGTGTALGDPIEMRAIHKVMAKGRSMDDPLLVGSVKTNLGHMESAAGIGSLMKAILACQHGQIPPHLHFTTPSPHIPWESMPIKVPTQSIPWPEKAVRRIAGVSSFGFSGTNVHAIVEAAPVDRPKTVEYERPMHVLTLSGRNPEAVRTLTERYTAHLDSHGDEDVGDICFTAGAGRSHFRQRMAVVGENRDDFAQKLKRTEAGQSVESVFAGQAPEGGREPKIGFLYTGQGSQYEGMGRALYETQPTFRQALDTCDDLLKPLLDLSITQLLYAGPSDGGDLQIHQTRITQPLLFALEYALTQLWKSWGVKPSVVMGHSVGEYVAACVAGVFKLEDGLRLIAERGRLMQGLPDNGRMAAVLADDASVSEALSSHSKTVSIAALNGPSNTVISGLGDDVQAVIEKVESRGIQTRTLNVSHAFHSPLMDPILDQFGEIVSQVTLSEPRIRMISNVTGGTVQGQEMTQADRWRRHVREPVRFSDSMKTLDGLDIPLVLEVGPHPVLLGMGRQCLPEHKGQWLPSLRRGRPDWRQMMESLSRLYVSGVNVDWDGFDRNYGRRKISLPTYPFERKVYWHDENSALLFEKQKQALSESADILNKFYEVEWRAATRIQDKPTDDSFKKKNWLILADKAGLAGSVAQAIEKGGGKCFLAFAGDCFSLIGDNRFTVHPYQRADYESLLNECTGRTGVAVTGILHLWSFDIAATEEDDSTMMDSQGDGLLFLCGSLVHLLQALDGTDHLRSARLWIATCGAQSPDSRHIASVVQGSLWGLGRTMLLEHPGLVKGLIDVSPENRDDQVRQLLNEILCSDGKTQIRYCGNERQFSRLVKLDPVATTPLSIDSGGSYLITGGLGALGLHVARWLVGKGARSIVLAARSDPSDSAKEKIVQMEAEGCRVDVRLLDVADKEALDRMMDAFGQSLPPLKGVIHAAGVLGDGMLLNQTVERFAEVMKPKTVGAWNLHRATREMDLGFFVLFSSVAGVFGTPGQGNYAAGNAFLDSLSRYRMQLGLPGVSIAWGPWADQGMAAELERERRFRLEKTGMHMIKPEYGVMALEAALEHSGPQVCVVDAHWSTLADHLPSESDRLFFSSVTPQLQSHRTDDTGESDTKGELGRYQEMRLEERRSFLEDYLRRKVAEIIGTTAQDLSSENNFLELGADSLMITEIINQIQRDFGLTLYAREVFEKPTVDQLAGYIDSELSAEKTHAVVMDQDRPEPVDLFTKVGSDQQRGRFLSEEENPPVAFILSSPRCGSTLLRVMLAGHSRLFCPPELHLLQFSNLVERREALGQSYLSEGLDRALMELRDINSDESKALIEDLVQQGKTVQEVYRILQESVHPRLLIDKSPTYGADIETLQKAEYMFENPKYIHLVRHPYSMIESFVRNRMERLTGVQTEDPSRLAEQVWCETNANIIDFFETVDHTRHLQVLFEDLVRDPEKVIRNVCRFLEIPYEPSLLEPYEGNRMTDGLHKNALGIGDPNFMNRKTIDASLADVWKTISIGRKPGGYARRVAKEIGYDFPAEPNMREGIKEEREEILI